MPSTTVNAIVPLATPAASPRGLSRGRIDLAWTDRSSVENSYVIEQSLDGAEQLVASGNHGGQRYGIRRPRSVPRGGRPISSASGLTATPPATIPPFSTIATVTTPAFPSQPASVTATATAEGTITLTWADTTNETGYRMERSLNGTTGWSQVGTPAANATSFSDTGLAENTRYYYRLIALNAAGSSAPSVSANAVTPLSTPGSVAATAVWSTRIDLTWTDRSASEAIRN